MAPDKIYLPKEEIEERKPWIETTYDPNWDECYIHKDTLIEWLRKEYETVSWYDEKMRHVTGCVGDTSSSGKAQAYQAVIDKLNSM